MSPLSRRAALASAVLLLAPVAHAYPDRPVRIIVPFPPGQAADLFARLLADRLSAMWPHRVLVENRAGGAGAVGLEAGKQAAPDGHTLIMGTSGTLGINPNVIARLPYDPIADFAPVSNVFLAPLVLVVHPEFPARTVQDLVARAKAEPGALNYASAGPGTAQHLTAELFATRAGIRMTHVPYRGSAPAMTDVIAGVVPIMLDSVAAALGHIRAGRVRPLAVTTATRSPLLADIPTVAETVAPDFDAAGWSGIIAPRATPEAIVTKVSADIQAALAHPETRQRMIDMGGIPAAGPPEAFGAFIRDEIAKWGEVARAANVRLDG
jgi:tripartite-type tricarboxylate transporter receptor subunit TctC